jgi:8-oxo-dGTP diphosphatase
LTIGDVRASVAPGVGHLLVPSDELDVRFPGDRKPFSVRMRIVRASADRMAATFLAGTLEVVHHEATLTHAGDRTVLAESVRWEVPEQSGPFADSPLFRRFVRAVLARRLQGIRKLAVAWAGRPVVVGAAIVHRGRLLGQCRSYPARDAGRWELPGGRVEIAEQERDAVVRECREELAVEVTPGSRIGTDIPLPNGMVLRVYAAELVDPCAAPRAVEHREVRWFGPDELGGLDWLEADRLMVHSLRDLLRS